MRDTQRHSIAGCNCSLCSLIDLAAFEAASTNLGELAHALLPLLDQELRVANNVDEQNVADLKFHI